MVRWVGCQLVGLGWTSEDVNNTCKKVFEEMEPEEDAEADDEASMGHITEQLLRAVIERYLLLSCLLQVMGLLPPPQTLERRFEPDKP